MNLSLALAGPGWGHMMNGDGSFWPWGLLMMLFWLALIAVAAWVVWSAVQRNGSAQRPGPPGETERAREILAERYARGEIDTDEYEERLAGL